MKRMVFVVCCFSVNLGVWGMYPNKDAASSSRGNESLFSARGGGSSSERTSKTAMRRLPTKQGNLSPIKGYSRFSKLEGRIRKDRSFFTRSEVNHIISRFDEENRKLEQENRRLEKSKQIAEQENQTLRAGNQVLATKLASSASRNSKIINSLRGLVTRPPNNDKPYLESMSDYCRDIVSYGPREQVSDGSIELFDNVKHKQMQQYMSEWSDEDIQQFLPEFIEFTVNSFRDGIACLYRFDQKIQQQYQEQQRQIQELSDQNKTLNREVQCLSDQNKKLAYEVQGLLAKEQVRQTSEPLPNPQVQEILMQNKSLKDQMVDLQKRYDSLEKMIQAGLASDDNEAVADSNRVEESSNMERAPGVLYGTPENNDMEDVTGNVGLGEDSKWSFTGQIEGNMPNGFGRLDIYGAYVIGNFVSGDLKIEKSIQFKGRRGKEKEFKVVGSFDRGIFLPKEYLFDAQESVSIDGFLCFVRSEMSGNREGAVFDRMFVYWGQLDKQNLPRGTGMMIRSNGSIRQGFYSSGDWLRND